MAEPHEGDLAREGLQVLGAQRGHERAEEVKNDARYGDRSEISPIGVSAGVDTDKDEKDLDGHTEYE